jgi:modification methylase
MDINFFVEGTIHECKWGVYNNNCIEFMDKHLAPDSIDCIITSPPYLNKRAYSAEGKNEGNKGSYFYSSVGQAMENEIGCNQTLEEYLKSISSVLSLCYKILKPDRFLAININKYRDNKRTFDISHHFISLASSFGFQLRDIMIWIKENPRPVPPNSIHYYLDDGWEYILLFSKGTALLNDRISMTNHLNYTCPNCNTENSISLKIKPNYLKTYIGFTEKSSLKSYHPAKFPVALPDFIIKLCCKENYTVFDPFAGIGSTLIAALQNNANVIGCELNPTFFNSILKEIEKLSSI